MVLFFISSYAFKINKICNNSHDFLGYIYGDKDIKMGHSVFRTIWKSYFQRIKSMGKFLSMLDHVKN